MRYTSEWVICCGRPVVAAGAIGHTSPMNDDYRDDDGDDFGPDDLPESTKHDHANLSEPILNELGWELVEESLAASADLNIRPVRTEVGATLIDFGCETDGSLGAGLALAEIASAGLIDLDIETRSLDGMTWPHLRAVTDAPFEACLLSQFAGWKIRQENYFAIASGPMRAARGAEEIYQKMAYFESARRACGVLEADDLPTDRTLEDIAEECGVHVRGLGICVAPVTSLAGSMQVVARSVETAMHKLHEVGFDVTQVVSAAGTAPLPPVMPDPIAGIGTTNDAILYGGSVTLWVDAEDDQLAELGPKVPSWSSEAAGQPFAEVFEAAGGDFYAIDPLLFSPAEIILHNLATGRIHRHGRIDESVVMKSFGL